MLAARDGEITGYYRVRVEERWVTEEEDLWDDPDDEISGEFQYELGIGDYKTRDLLTWATELKKQSPAQYARLELLIADGLKMPLDDRAVLALQKLGTEWPVAAVPYGGRVSSSGGWPSSISGSR